MQPPELIQRRLNTLGGATVGTEIRIAGPLRNESVTAFYSSSRGYVAAYDRRSAGRHCGLPPASRFRFAGSRLSHDPGHDVLSRGRSDRDCLLSHRPLGAAIRTSTRIEPDDLD